MGESAIDIHCKRLDETALTTRNFENIIAVRMVPGVPLAVHTAARFKVSLCSAGDYQADLAALDEL